MNKKSSGGRWTEEEDVIIRTKYSCLLTSEVMALLPGRSASSIQCRAQKLGIKYYCDGVCAVKDCRPDGRFPCRERKEAQKQQRTEAAIKLVVERSKQLVRC